MPKRPLIPQSMPFKVILMLIICLAFFMNILINMMIVPIVPTLLESTFVNKSCNALNESKLLGIVNLTHVDSKENGLNCSLSEDGVFDMDIKLGFFFGLYGIVQLIVSPVVGLIVDRTCPIFAILVGILFDIASVTTYAFAENNYGSLLAGRVLNSVAWSGVGCGSYTFLAEVFHTDTSRSKMIGIVNIFLYLGSSLGPFYGGATHQYFGQNWAFLLTIPVLAFIFILTLVLVPHTAFRCLFFSFDRKERISTRDSSLSKVIDKEVLSTELEKGDPANVIDGLLDLDNISSKQVFPTPIYRLLIDPYVMILLVCFFVSNVGISAIETALSPYLHHRFHLTESEQGIVWIPGVAFNFLGTMVAMLVCTKIRQYRYIVAFLSILLGAVGFVVLPFVTPWQLVILPLGINFFIVALIDCTMFPLAIAIVGQRYTSMYGSISALTTTAISLSDVIGSMLAGIISNKFGFDLLNYIIFLTLIVYSPFLLCLRQFSSLADDSTPGVI